MAFGINCIVCEPLSVANSRELVEVLQKLGSSRA